MDERLELRGLTLGRPQAWRSIRLVPLIREQPIEDLRLDPITYAVGEQPDWVSLPKGEAYSAFIPHAMVASWSKDGSRPSAAFGTQLVDPRRRDRSIVTRPVGLHRMAKQSRARTSSGVGELRFLPLHLAMDGYLLLHVRGPDVVRPEWSHSAGLLPRSENSVRGRDVRGLEEALRVFEILAGQVGVLVFVADALAAAFVVPHPDDYRRLHRTLLADFYGEIVERDAGTYDTVAWVHSPIDASVVATLADLERELGRIRTDWSGFFADISAQSLHQPVKFEHIYRLGRYDLLRWVPTFDPQLDNHIGELIRSSTGETAYLSTFRLSGAQVRRGFLLTTLARHEWELAAAASAMSVPVAELEQRIVRAGFGSMLKSPR